MRHPPKLGRRAFVRGLGTLALGAGLGRPTRARSGTTRTRGIVVGAGAAGLRAARLLRDAGVDLVVLEGRARPGGRVWTDRSLGVPIDLGAAWIHGSEGNPLAALAAGAGTSTHRTDYDSLRLFDGAGNPLDEEGLARLERIDADLARVLEDPPEDARTLAEALRLLRRSLHRSPGDRVALDFLEHARLVCPLAAEPREMSATEDDGEGLGGGDHLPSGGIWPLLEPWRAGLDLRLEHVVSRIEFGREGVRVTTDRGVFEAEAALVTLPLGVLKAEGVRFSPPLPIVKRRAIQRLGFGALEKVALRFRERFWGPGDAEFLGYLSTRRGEFPTILDLTDRVGAPVLVGFQGGDPARALAARDEAVADLCGVLKRLFPRAYSPPVASTRTRWATDPFSRGAYSFLGPGATSADREALAAPLLDTLFFAGEATSKSFPSTVHGAILSAEREVRRILG